nr:unnamed protein product [Spirometra erinaceieuropaei]
MISPVPRVAAEDPTNILHRFRQFLWAITPVPPRTSVSESNLEKDLVICSRVYLRHDRVLWPLEPSYDGPFRVIFRGANTSLIQRGTREEVVCLERLRAVDQDTSPNKLCGSIPPSSPPRPPIFPFCIIPLPPCALPPNATTPSSTSNTVAERHSHSPPVPIIYIFPVVDAMPIFLTAWLAMLFFRHGHFLWRRYTPPLVQPGGTVAVLPPCSLLPCHAALLSAPHSLSIRCCDARGLSIASRVLEAKQLCPFFDWLAATETK